MAKKRIVTPGANTTLVEAEQPLRCSRDFLRGIGASQENRPEQLPFRPSQQQKAILGHVGHRLRNDEAPGPESMAPEFPQGLVNQIGRASCRERVKNRGVAGVAHTTSYQ